MNANLLCKRIEMSKNEAKAAGKLNTPEAKMLKEYRKEFPGFEIYIKPATRRKTEFKGLDYKYMRTYKQQIYADEIIKKYHKYCNDFGKYDEFIVLCDARYTINVTSFWDSKDVIDMAKEKCNSLSGFTVCILRQNSLCKNEIDTFKL